MLVKKGKYIIKKIQYKNKKKIDNKTRHLSLQSAQDKSTNKFEKKIKKNNNRI